jgi:GntR family transcriptional regulator of gluconate operon
MIKKCKTISEQVADLIREKIYDETFPEKSLLKEQMLSDMFEVSRGTVRHAMTILIKEGLIISIPNVGAKVSPYPSEQAIKMIIEIRNLLERRVLETVWETLRNSTEEWEEFLKQMENAAKNNDAIAFENADIAFHRYFISMYPDVHILEIWEQLISRMRVSYLRIDDLNAGYISHKKNFDSVVNNNPKEILEDLFIVYNQPKQK